MLEKYIFLSNEIDLILILTFLRRANTMKLCLKKLDCFRDNLSIREFHRACKVLDKRITLYTNFFLTKQEVTSKIVYLRFCTHADSNVG